MRTASAALRALLTGLAIATISTASRSAEPTPFDVAPLSDDELAIARGGFDLPSGARIDFGVMIRTSVDGVQVLQTRLQILGDSITSRVEAAPGVLVSGSAIGTGSISVNVGDRAVSTTANLSDLLIQHEIGKQISSLIVNTADNRIVDNQVSIDLRLDGVQPLSLGSIGFRVQSVGIEAATWRAGS